MSQDKTEQNAPLQVFEFEGEPLKGLELDQDSWVSAIDICNFTGVKNVSQAVSRLEDDEKRVIISNDSAGRPQKMVFVNEAGVYRLLLSTRLRKDHPTRLDVAGIPRTRRTLMATYDRKVNRIDSSATHRFEAERWASVLRTESLELEKLAKEQEDLDRRLALLDSQIQSRAYTLNDRLVRCGFDVDQLVNVRGDVYRIGEEVATYVGPEPDDEDEEDDDFTAEDERREWASEYADAVAIS